MTLPNERFRALKQAKKILEDLCDPGKTPRVPSIIRDRARVILRHYPHDCHVDELAHASPSILEKNSLDDKIKQATR